MKKKYQGEVKFELVKLFDPPINWNGQWVGPFIKKLSKEELKKIYPECNKL
jgi:hypothetical protein